MPTLRLWTTEEIGNTLGITAERVRQILSILKITPRKFGKAFVVVNEQFEEVKKYHKANNRPGPKAKKGAKK